MTRYLRRSAFGVGGVVLGAAICVSAVTSQDSPPAVEPAAKLPSSGEGAAGAPAVPAAPSAAQRNFDTAPASPPDGRPTATPALAPGQTATQRASDDGEGARPPATNGFPGLPGSGGGPAGGFGSLAVDEPGAPTTQQGIASESVVMRVMPLKKVHAASVKEIIETLLPNMRGTMAVDASTNSLVTRVPISVYVEIEELVKALDSMEAQRSEAKDNAARVDGRSGKVSRPGMPMEGIRSGMAPGGVYSGGKVDALLRPGAPTPASSSDVRKQYEAADRAARELAAKMKRSGDVSQQAELRQRVSEAFRLRQTLLRSELDDVQRRMATIQETINLRDRVSDKIVERRMSDLLDSSLKWEPISSPETGAGGFIDSSGVQWPRPAGMPGGMGPDGGSAPEKAIRWLQQGSGTPSGMPPAADPASNRVPALPGAGSPAKESASSAAFFTFFGKGRVDEGETSSEPVGGSAPTPAGVPVPKNTPAAPDPNGRIRGSSGQEPIGGDVVTPRGR